MSGSEPAVGLRPARDRDRAFLERLYVSTRVEELAPVPWSDDQKRAFLAQQFHAQSVDYARNYPGAAFQVVEVDGRSAGRLIVDRRDDELHIVDIALLPEFRGRGVGSGLLGELLDEADRAGVRTTIYVEHENRAQALYRRLGFGPVDDTGVYFLMERSPGGGQAKTTP